MTNVRRSVRKHRATHAQGAPGRRNVVLVSVGVSPSDQESSRRIVRKPVVIGKQFLVSRQRSMGMTLVIRGYGVGGGRGRVLFVVGSAEEDELRSPVGGVDGASR